MPAYSPIPAAVPSINWPDPNAVPVPSARIGNIRPAAPIPKFDPYARPFVHSTMTDLRTRAERPELIWTAAPMDWDFLLLDEMTQPGIPVGSYPMMTPLGGEMWTIPDEFK